MTWVAVGVMAAGAIAGKMKNDRAKEIENSDRKLAAETQRYSPWTGLSANQVRSAGSVGGDIFGGGVQGAMMGQAINNGMNKGMNGTDTGSMDASGVPDPDAATATGRFGLKPAGYNYGTFGR